jgi:hypothetical protein
MVTDAKQIEMNRIVDMIKTRSYIVTSSQFKDNDVVITVEKGITPELATTKESEATWITNFLKSQGWEVSSTSFPENKIVVEFVKRVMGPVP